MCVPAARLSEVLDNIGDHAPAKRVVDPKISEYRNKTGKDMDDVLKTTVIHGAMDTESGLDRFVLCGEEPGLRHDRGEQAKLLRPRV